MKNSILAGTVFAAMVLGSASAQTQMPMQGQPPSQAQGQTWEVNGGTYTFLGCTPVGQTVQCGLTFLQTVVGEGGVYQLDPRDVQAFSEIGQLSRATRVNVAGQGFGGPNRASSTKGTPIAIVFELGALPAGTRSVRALIIEGHKLDNVQISSAQTPSGQMPVVQTPSTAPGTAGSPVPVPPVSVPQNMGVPAGFNVQFSDCHIVKGVLTCTATFMPPR